MSIYAFAIDNFSRPQEEVDALMRLATTRLKELCSYGYVDASPSSEVADGFGKRSVAKTWRTITVHWAKPSIARRSQDGSQSNGTNDRKAQKVGCSAV